MSFDFFMDKHNQSDNFPFFKQWTSTLIPKISTPNLQGSEIFACISHDFNEAHLMFLVWRFFESLLSTWGIIFQSINFAGWSMDWKVGLQNTKWRKYDK